MRHKTRFSGHNIFSDHILLYRRSRILQSIYFLIRMYNYTKVRGLNSGKHYIIAKQPKRDQLSASFSSSSKINCMLITRLICIQWKSSGFDSFSQFPQSSIGTPGTLNYLSERTREKKKKKKKKKKKTKKRLHLFSETCFSKTSIAKYTSRYFFPIVLKVMSIKVSV